MDTEFATRCIHLPEEKQLKDRYGAMTFPIYQTATFAHPGPGRSTGYDYSRSMNPSRDYVERVVASLEEGCGAIAASSGMAAVSLVMELFSPGDTILIDSDLYGGSLRLFRHIGEKNGLRFRKINCSTDPVADAADATTKAIFLETPSNPTMRVSDIAAIASAARGKGLLLIVDNTFLSPCFQKPLALGADLVIHSGTKYLGGHNDTLAGFVAVKDPELEERLRFLHKTTGAVLAPLDCYLITRGIKTLPIRMRQAEENAVRLAHWLRQRKEVTRVYYPGLEDHPGHETMKRQASGFGAMISFETATREQALSLLEGIRLISYAESLGGVESLLTYPLTQTHADVPEDERLANGINDRLLRLSVGIEDANDLIRDLEQALDAYTERQNGKKPEL